MRASTKVTSVRVLLIFITIDAVRLLAGTVFFYFPWLARIGSGPVLYLFYDLLPLSVPEIRGKKRQTFLPFAGWQIRIRKILIKFFFKC